MAILIVKVAEMNVKRLITGLALSMLLSSGTANADWGDVYYCKMTNYVKIELDGEFKKYALDKFQLKIDQAKKSIVFGKGGFFSNSVKPLVEDRYWPKQDSWNAYSRYSALYLHEGKFLYSMIGTRSLVSISADCDKF